MLIGRITKELELRKTPSGVSVVQFNLAVDRGITKEKKDQGEQSADFIQCVVWRSSAEFLMDYATKGTLIALQGHISTRNYESEKDKHYITEVVADGVKILGGWKERESYNQYYQPTLNDNNTDMMGFTVNSDDLPFY